MWTFRTFEKVSTVPYGKSIAETHMIMDRNTVSITDTDMDRDTDDSDGSNMCVTND